MKIVKLIGENVKCLKAVEVDLDGKPVVVVTGPNGAGKSTFIDLVQYVMGGKRNIPAEPLRRGTNKGRIELKTDSGLTVQLRLTPKGVTLEATDKDGVKYTRPQTMLNELVGPLSFDPLEFSRMDPGEQLTTLKTLLGLDFTELDQKRQAAYDSRRAVNRDLKAAEARLAGLPYHEEAPEAEVSIAALAEEMERRRMVNAENGELRRDLQTRREEAHELKDKIEELEKRLTAAKVALAAKVEEGKRLAAEVKGLGDEDVNEIHDQIANAEEDNRKVRENETHRNLQIEISRLAKESQALSDTILEVASEKAMAVADANMPIAGLGLAEDGVTLNGLPLEQASSAEQLRTSVAMGLALNPTFQVILLRDGSLLDKNSYRMVVDMVKEAGAQTLIEMVHTDDPAALRIEDGMVKKDGKKALADAPAIE